MKIRGKKHLKEMEKKGNALLASSNTFRGVVFDSVGRDDGNPRIVAEIDCFGKSIFYGGFFSEATAVYENSIYSEENELATILNHEGNEGNYIFCPTIIKSKEGIQPQLEYYFNPSRGLSVGDIYAHWFVLAMPDGFCKEGFELEAKHVFDVFRTLPTGVIEHWGYYDLRHNSIVHEPRGFNTTDSKEQYAYIPIACVDALYSDMSKNWKDIIKRLCGDFYKHHFIRYINENYDSERNQPEEVQPVSADNIMDLVGIDCDKVGNLMNTVTMNQEYVLEYVSKTLKEYTSQVIAEQLKEKDESFRLMGQRILQTLLSLQIKLGVSFQSEIDSIMQAFLPYEKQEKVKVNHEE